MHRNAVRRTAAGQHVGLDLQGHGGQLTLDDAGDARQMRERRGTRQAQAQQTAAAPRDPANTAFGIVDAGEDADRLGLEELSRRGERHLPRGAVEQRDVELGFELPDRVRQRGLRDVQLLGRLAEMARVGHGDEVAKMPELHRDLLLCDG